MAIDRIKKLKLQNYTLYIGIAMLAIIFEILCAFNGLKFFTASNIYNIISEVRIQPEVTLRALMRCSKRTISVLYSPFLQSILYYS